MITNARPPLPSDVIARTRAALHEICAAAHEADVVVEQFLALPCVQAALRNRRPVPPGKARHRDRPSPAELLNLPPDRWDPALDMVPGRQQSALVQDFLAAAEACASTAPERAESIAAFVLRQVARVRAISYAPLLRRQLIGRALIVRARALIALHGHANALPVIAEAYAALPKTTACKRHRVHAQLLRAVVLAAGGDDREALQILIVCARFAVEHIDHALLVDALAAIAVILSVHSQFDVARPALTLAAHVVRHYGDEYTMSALQNTLTECIFLGYTSDSKWSDAEKQQSTKVTY